MEVMTPQAQALKLAQQGFKVYPVIAGTKQPPKGSHSYLDATTDPATINGWFQQSPNLNIGLDLVSAGLLVVDIDVSGTNQQGQTVHTNANGGQALIKYLKAHNLAWPQGSYTERTPHNGRHVFFKLPHPLDKGTKKTGKAVGLPGVDLLADSVIVAPSVVDGRSYGVTSNNTLKDARPAPDWIIGLLNKPVCPPTTNPTSSILSRYGRKKWTGQFLDRIAAGVTEGSRNEWLTSITGQLFSTKADAGTVYELMGVINQNFISPPLPDSEVNDVFKSVIKYHR